MTKSKNRKRPLPIIDQRNRSQRPPTGSIVQAIKNRPKYRKPPNQPKPIPTFAQDTPLSSAARQIAQATKNQRERFTEEDIKRRTEALIRRIHGAKYLEDISRKDLEALRSLRNPRLTRQLLANKRSRVE